MIKSSSQVRLLYALILALQCILSTSYSINSKFFDFKGHPIHYEVAMEESNVPQFLDTRHKPPPILLLNGFGVGSFHQHRLIHELMSKNNDIAEAASSIVYCMDYLGQGKSWPMDCNDGCSENERGLSYSGATWVDQIIAFLETVVLSDVW
ncbi:hypothetical protein MPSEU_000230500 [Mayamaea pseudoterrestris]|nr:hypothetical protein MPSEU_000230500 [Mayamaea pseudoterrestris]